MKLRAYLVDDEPLALERLQRLLEETGRVEVIGCTTIPEQAVAALRANAADVCFLDIQMPRLNGFEVLAQLTVQPVVIFTTAYDQFALRAFGVNSVDYLLKPIERESLDRSLNKLEQLRASGQITQPHLQVLLTGIMTSLNQQAKAEYLERIASRLGDRLWFLDLKDVTHLYAEDKLTYAVSKSKAYTIDYTIAELEEKLNPKKFCRIHRGKIVNLDWIKDVTLLPGGALNVRLKDGSDTELLVARDRAREFREWAGC
jgi:two-component system LytT family response regulator